MLKRYIKYFSLFLIVLLQACSTTSGGDDDQVVNVDIDASGEQAFKKGVESMKRGRDSEAIRYFTSMTKNYPNYAGSFINLGIIYTKQKKYDEALEVLLQATTIKPTDAIAYNQLGVVYRHLGKFKEAESAYLQALKLKPDYPLAHYNIGILYDVYFNELGKAKTHYEKYQALSGSPDSQVAKWLEDINFRLKNTK